MDDIAEQHDVANEISNAISNPVGFADDLDDDELEKELEELEQEGLEEDLLKVPGPTELPAVPTGSIANKPIKPASKFDHINNFKNFPITVTYPYIGIYIYTGCQFE